MSRRTVGMLIERLLTEEDLRIRFVVDRLEALAAFSAVGDLTGDEIDLFFRADARLWFWDRLRSGEQVH